jgi:hypothetical protein
MVLSINQRARIVWRAGQGWSWREIGNDVGCDPETARRIVNNFIVRGTLEPKKELEKIKQLTKI